MKTDAIRHPYVITLTERGSWDENTDTFTETYAVANGRRFLPIVVTVFAANLPGEAVLYASEDRKDRICSFPEADFGRLACNFDILLDALNDLPADADPAAPDSPIRSLRFIR